jgi:hypothetical protein
MSNLEIYGSLDLLQFRHHLARRLLASYYPHNSFKSQYYQPLDKERLLKKNKRAMANALLTFNPVASGLKQKIRVLPKDEGILPKNEIQPK